MFNINFVNKLNYDVFSTKCYKFRFIGSYCLKQYIIVQFVPFCGIETKESTQKGAAIIAL